VLKKIDFTEILTQITRLFW